MEWGKLSNISCSKGERNVEIWIFISTGIQKGFWVIVILCLVCIMSIAVLLLFLLLLLHGESYVILSSSIAIFWSRCLISTNSLCPPSPCSCGFTPIPFSSPRGPCPSKQRPQRSACTVVHINTLISFSSIHSLCHWFIIHVYAQLSPNISPRYGRLLAPSNSKL